MHSSAVLTGIPGHHTYTARRNPAQPMASGASVLSMWLALSVPSGCCYAAVAESSQSSVSVHVTTALPQPGPCLNLQLEEELQTSRCSPQQLPHSSPPTVLLTHCAVLPEMCSQEALLAL